MPVEHWNCPGRHLNSAARKGCSASGRWEWGGRRPLGPRESGSPGVGASPPRRALTTVRGLVRVVPAVVLRVTLPPEGDALVILAHKLGGQVGGEGVNWGVWGTQEIFFLRGLVCLLEAAGSGILGEGELDGRLGFGDCREASRGYLCGAWGWGYWRGGVRVGVGGVCKVTGIKVLLWGDKR